MDTQNRRDIWTASNTEEMVNRIDFGAKDINQFYKYGEDIASFFINKYNINKNTVVLDYGCGVGRISIPISKIAKKVYCIDSSIDYIKILKSKIESDNINNISVVYSENYKYQKLLIDEKIDFIFFHTVAQHIDKPLLWSILSDLKSVMHDNSKIYIHFTMIEDNDNFNDFYYFVLNNAYNNPINYMRHDFYTKEEIFYRVKKAGLKIVNAEKADKDIRYTLELNNNNIQKNINYGCFYYLWYDDNISWINNCIYSKFDNMLYPRIGCYKSTNKEVIESHINQANFAKIDYFIICLTKKIIEDGTLKEFVKNYEKVVKTKNKYPLLAIQIESIDFANNYDYGLYNIDDNKTLDIILYLKKSFNIIGDKLLFKINDKYPIFIYLSRLIKNIDYFISYMRKNFDNYYLCGDEIWYNNLDERRIILFDGIYNYNMYSSSEIDTNKKIGDNLLNLFENILDEYYYICKKNNIDFLPSIIPRYNDRVIRSIENNYIVPEENGTFFKSYLSRIKEHYDINNILITSWNEWYENTQIEPCGSIESYGTYYNEPSKFTDLYDNKIYGYDYLNILKLFKENKINDTPYELCEENSIKIKNINKDLILQHNKSHIIKLNNYENKNIILSNNHKQYIKITNNNGNIEISNNKNNIIFSHNMYSLKNFGNWSKEYIIIYIPYGDKDITKCEIIIKNNKNINLCYVDF